MGFDWDNLRREVIVRACIFLPREKNISMERWMRGRQEYRKVKAANSIIVSFPNSGRTWLHVLLAKYYQVAHGHSIESSIDIHKLRKTDSTIPNIFFTHDNYLRDFTKDGASKAAYVGKPVILLVRDPADVSVSQFFQWRHRMRRRKVRINDYPANMDLPLYRFTMAPQGVLARVIIFLNGWAAAIQDSQSILVIRYEDLTADTHTILSRVLMFLGEVPDPEAVSRAVDYSSLANMRKLEDGGGRLFRPGNWRSGKKRTSDSYKARRAKIGGYRGDFSSAEQALIDQDIDRNLAPIFGYQRFALSEVVPLSINA
jgi:hypothetical protein